MKAIYTFRMDKSTLSVGSISEELDDKEYWHAKTPQERLQAVALMRQINYGYDPTPLDFKEFLKLLNSDQVEKKQKSDIMARRFHTN